MYISYYLTVTCIRNLEAIFVSFLIYVNSYYTICLDNFKINTKMYLRPMYLCTYNKVSVALILSLVALRVYLSSPWPLHHLVYNVVYISILNDISIVRPFKSVA